HWRGGSPETLLLAAGGVADGRGLAAALILGADGVVVGTRFWASAEALTKKAHTDKAIATNGDSTIRTKALDALRGVAWPRQYSLRFLKNKLSNEWANREEQAFQAFGSEAERYAQARVQDDLDTVAVVCGEAIGIIHDRPSAESIVTSTTECAAKRKVLRVPNVSTRALPVSACGVLPGEVVRGRHGLA